MSTHGPNVDTDMATHSACQPGRPGPHGESHSGCSGSAGCHTATSNGSSLRGSSGLPPYSRASRSAVSSLIRDRATTCRPRKYTPPSRTYAAPDSASAPASRITAST